MARKSAAAADASPATQPATDASLEAAPDIAGDRAGTPATTAAGASSAPAKYTAVVFTNAVRPAPAARGTPEAFGLTKASKPAKLAYSTQVDADGVTSWPFKRPGVAAAPSARRRNVKQILAAEHFEQVPPNVPTCTGQHATVPFRSSQVNRHCDRSFAFAARLVVSIAAPPSHLPRPKVCDVTGLPVRRRACPARRCTL